MIKVVRFGAITLDSQVVDEIKKIIEYWKITYNIYPNDLSFKAYEDVTTLGKALYKSYRKNEELLKFIKVALRACKTAYTTIYTLRSDPKQHMHSFVFETLGILKNVAEIFIKLKGKPNE
jgi:hypothetical protein